MASKKSISIGLLILVVLSASVYVLLPENARIDVENTKTTFKVYENNSWILSGTEYTKIYDGTTLIRANNRVVNYSVDLETNLSTIWRYSYFKNDVVAIDTYKFNGNSKDIELFPVSHEINVLNGEDLILVYEVNDLLYTGETKKDISSPQNFGHKMKVEWEKGNYYSRIFKYSNKDVGKLEIKYKINSSDYSKNVRLFDPISLHVSNAINLNVTYENNFSHLNISDPNLILYMPFDVNSSGTVYDYSNNSNDGTFNGSMIYTASGKYGGAVSLDGDNDFVEIPQSSSINISGNAITMSAWVKFDNAPTGTTAHMIVSKPVSATTHSSPYFAYNIQRLRNTYFNWDFPRIWVATANNPSGVFTAANSNSLTTNKWYHIVGVYNGTHILIYLDGSQLGSAVSATGNLKTYETPLRIGVNGDLSEDMNGSVDEVMIYNRALSASEILAIYNNQSARFYPTGEMLFEDNNFGTNNTVNISIDGCQTLVGSYLQGKINDGSYVNFTNCVLNNYSMAGNLTNANVTVKLVTNTTDFYSPIVLGNITLSSYSIVGGDSCTYTSGNWNVDCSDNCSITENVNLGGNNISFSGSGIFDVMANITNIDNIFKPSGCQINVYTDVGSLRIV